MQFLRGVGEFRAKLLAGAGVMTVGDLLWYFPFRYEQQPRPQRIDTLILDQEATIIAAVESVRCRGFLANVTVNAIVNDGSGKARITWFNSPYLRERLQRGQILRLFGKVGVHEDSAQLINPRVEWLDPQENLSKWDFGRVVPIYRAVGKLTSGHLAGLVETALTEALSAVREPLPAALLAARGFPDRRESVRRLHHPDTPDEIHAARHRLAYEELLLMQLAVGLQKDWARSHARSPRLITTPAIDRRIRERFPFALTAAQNRVIGQISADMARDRPMTRLLQGDVGSGKTVVALHAGLVAVANRAQCAILAPTEVLAAQHFTGIEKYLAGSRVRRCLLTGKTPAGERKNYYAAIAAGRMDLIVGTQALLESKVRMPRLGLVIVDEQHKFGVAQRAILRNKPRDGRIHAPGLVPHYLVMTATPIPRTLSMTVFGDLDVSIIDALPPGRQPIVTRLIGSSEAAAAWLEVRRRLAAGEQAYVVYPLVEESEVLDLRAATTEVDRVRKLLPGARVGLMHGRMKKLEKQAVMREFIEHRLDVLVSTTVIEVGVDVPNATVMVIEHAERHGLSGLHQLRGRVGRGAKPSICLLMTDRHGAQAHQRLRILCETNDGFRIAEEDLKLRGPGELLGTRQHGLTEFRVASLVEDVHLLMQARDDAGRIIREDPRLLKPVHAPLRAELRRRFRDKLAFIDIG